jgi:hypothetical protein
LIFQSIAMNGNVFVSSSWRKTAAPAPSVSVGENRRDATSTAP